MLTERGRRDPAELQSLLGACFDAIPTLHATLVHDRAKIMNFFMHPDMAGANGGAHAATFTQVWIDDNTSRGQSIQWRHEAAVRAGVRAVTLRAQEPDRTGRANQEERDRDPEAGKG